MKWRYPPDFPKPEQTIVAELLGCKITKFLRFTVREGEGLGHIKKWVPVAEFEWTKEETDAIKKRIENIPEISQNLLAEKE